MNIRLLILLLLSLALTACGAETVPEETADPPQTVQPAEDASPDEPEDPASARGIPPLEGTPDGGRAGSGQRGVQCLWETGRR